MRLSRLLLLGLIIIIHAKQSKDTKCATENLYDTIIVYGFDQKLNTTQDGEVFVAMNSDSNTLKFRQKTYQWFYDVYGLQFDPKDSNIQIANNVKEIMVSPIQFNEAITFPIYAFHDALDRKTSPFTQNTHRIPITNTRIIDAIYMVQIIPSQISVSWINKNINSDFYDMLFTLKPSESIFSGSYRIVVDGVAATNEETDIYYNIVPGHIFDVNAEIIECELKSTIWGKGLTLGHFFMRPLKYDQNILNIQEKSVMTFPATIVGNDEVNGCKRSKDLELKYKDSPTMHTNAALLVINGVDEDGMNYSGDNKDYDMETEYLLIANLWALFAVIVSVIVIFYCCYEQRVNQHIKKQTIFEPQIYGLP